MSDQIHFRQSDSAADPATLRVGIDTGGTFTDVVAVDSADGRVHTIKTPSTPADPSRGVLDGLTRMLDLLSGDLADVDGISHGTTVATNALLADDFSGLGLLVTEGFRHILEIARQSVPEGYGNSYFWVKPDRIVGLHDVREVPGRLDHHGAEVRPLDEEAVITAARAFRDAGVLTVGISFLHSYADDRHERRAREVFADAHPGCTVSISSEVLREYREYERTVTTLVDAFTKPHVSRYLSAVAERLAGAVDGARSAAPPFTVMRSNGGVASAAAVARHPISTVLSGPAAGALGAAFVAGRAGFDRILSLDGGGTSTDVSVVEHGEPAITTEGVVGRFPIKTPMVDVVTVGTGGGSIAWVTPEGGLKVGPRSAGAEPGPICYGRGGTDPTVTDAHAVLGRIPPRLLGGEIVLDVDAAGAGFAALADRLGMDRDAAAAGVVEIAAWNQANAIRQVTVTRGLDVRDFTLVAGGGSGPLQACRLLDILGLPTALVPASPGTLSALGLLTVDVRSDEVRTHVGRHDHMVADPAPLAAHVADLEARCAQTLADEGHADDGVLVRSVDMRYAGQASEVRVPAPDGPVGPAFCERVLAAFHDEHERLYGYCYRDDPTHAVEWVNLRVTGIGPVVPPELSVSRNGGQPRPPAGSVRQRALRGNAGVTGAAGGSPADRPELPRPEPDRPEPPRPEPSGHRRVFWDAWTPTPLYDRAALSPGAEVTGPAVIEEYGSTCPLAPGFRARVDDLGNLLIERTPS